jgi:hypothetical protein
LIKTCVHSPCTYHDASEEGAVTPTHIPLFCSYISCVKEWTRAKSVTWTGKYPCRAKAAVVWWVVIRHLKEVFFHRVSISLATKKHTTRRRGVPCTDTLEYCNRFTTRKRGTAASSCKPKWRNVLRKPITKQTVSEGWV